MEDQKREEEALRKPVFRGAGVLVIDEEGRAVEGARVRLYGIERYSRMPPDDDGLDPTFIFNPIFIWDFVTDPQGRFAAWFGKFNEHLYSHFTGDWRPGFGEFYLVASRTGYAGGVSRRIENWGEDESGEGWFENEWYSDDRPAVRLHDGRSNRVKIVMRRGFTLRGRVIDTKGNPAPNVTVTVNDDLHVDTHTGYGGAFFEQRAVTNSQGRFQIQRIYPNRFYLGVGRTDWHWFKTRIGRKQFRIPLGMVDPPTGAREVEITITVSRTPPFHHKGRVTDKAGKGIGNLPVVIGLSWNWPPSDYADNHHSERTETRADGTFELLSDAPFAQWVQLYLDKAGHYELVNAADADESKRPLRNVHLVVRYRREESGPPQ